MLISSHIPKTGGTTFRRDLTAALRGRVLWDYGDAPEVDDPALRESERQRRDHIVADPEGRLIDCEAIHGHFVADKYRDAFPDAKVIVFLRDPYRHAQSSYEAALRSVSEHPARRIFVEQKMSAEDLVAAFPDHQTSYLGTIPLAEFAAIGITERYEESLTLFERVLGISFARGLAALNLHPRQPGSPAVPPALRAAVVVYRARDIENYRLANERLTKMLRERAE